MTAKLMKRDRDLIGALSTKVCVLTFEQAMRGWWDRAEDPKGTVARRLRTLHADGHLFVFDAQGPDPSLATEPILRWSPGDPDPELDVAGEAASRRANATAVKLRLVAPDRSVGEALRSAGALAHELYLSELFIRTGSDAERWQLHPRSEATGPSWASLGGHMRVEVAHPGVGDAFARCRADGVSLEVW